MHERFLRRNFMNLHGNFTQNSREKVPKRLELNGWQTISGAAGAVSEDSPDVEDEDPRRREKNGPG
jgi:hypothetical protein